MTTSQYICCKHGETCQSQQRWKQHSLVQQSWITVHVQCTMKAAPLNPESQNCDSFKSINSDSIFSYIFFAWMKIDTNKTVFDIQQEYSAIKWMWIAVQIIWSRKNLMRNLWYLWPLIADFGIWAVWDIFYISSEPLEKKREMGLRKWDTSSSIALHLKD